MRSTTGRSGGKSLTVCLLMGLLVFPPVCIAEIYKYVDKDGVMHFTNVPVNPNYRKLPSLPVYASSRQPTTARFYPNRPLSPSFKGAQNECSSYDPHIRLACQRHGMDYNLVKAVIRAESAFDSQAVSPKGAKGLMQLMPGTSRDLGVSDPFDPYQNIDGGVRYLKEMMDRFNDVKLALAAYNAGPENVQKHGGIPPYDETQVYVRKVLEFYLKYSR